MFGWVKRESSREAVTVEVMRDALARLQTRLDAAERHRDEQLELTRRELAEAHETSRKLLKALGRSSLRIEQIETMVSSIAKLDAPPKEAVHRGDLDDLLDALDQLDRAIASTASRGLDDLETGLVGVRDRLEGFAGSLGLSRLRAVGIPVDATRFRVVGSREQDGAPSDQVVEIVRAAVLDGARLMREGEVIAAVHVQEMDGESKA